MKIDTRAVAVVWTILLPFCFIGCSKQLSRGRAAQMIQSHPSFTQTDDIKVPIGRCWYDWRQVREFYGDPASYKPLIRSGVLTMRETGQSYALWWKEYLVEFTPNGREAAKSWIATSEKSPAAGIFGGPSSQATVYRVPLAKRELVAVSGIVTEENKNGAEVKFDWQWVPTPQAKALSMVPPNETRHGLALFRLYDDGWRLEVLQP